MPGNPLMHQSVFRFKQFELKHGGSGMKLTTDSLLLGAWAQPSRSSTILDAGSGCGILALMCAQRFLEADITAVDNNPSAYAEAADNFKNSPWSDRLHPLQADINDWCADTHSTVDFIICNPPYFTETLRSPNPDRADARHAGGLSPQIIIEIAGRCLSPDGTLALVIPRNLEDTLPLPAALAQLHLSRLTRVSARQGKEPSLSLLQYSRTTTHKVCPEILDIRDRKGEFTMQYRQLTQPFLLYDKKK